MAWDYTKWYYAKTKKKILDAKREARDKQRPLLIAWSKLSGCINCTMFRRAVTCDGLLGCVKSQCHVINQGHPIRNYADQNKIVLLECEISSLHIDYTFTKYYEGYKHGQGNQSRSWIFFPTIFMLHVKENADCDTEDNYVLVRDTEIIFVTNGIGGHPIYGSLGKQSSLKMPSMGTNAFADFANILSAIFSGDYPEFNTYGMSIGAATPDISTLIGSERRLTFKEKRLQCLLRDGTISILISQIHQSSNYEGANAVSYTFEVSIERSEVPNVHFGESVLQKSIVVSASTNDSLHTVDLKLPSPDSIHDEWNSPKEIILKLKNSSMNFIETDRTTLSINVYKQPLVPMFSTDISESISLSTESVSFDVIIPNNTSELLWSCISGNVPSHISINTSLSGTSGKLTVTSSNTSKDFQMFSIQIYGRVENSNSVIEGDIIKFRAPTGS